RACRMRLYSNLSRNTMRQWPEKFIYVCNATQSAIVNALPIVHAGLERIDRIVIFCGVERGHAPDARETREALEPAERLANIVAEWAKPLGRKIPVEWERRGDADRVDVWAKHMKDVCDRAQE